MIGEILMDLLSKGKLNFPAIKIPEISVDKKTQHNPIMSEDEAELKRAINYALLEWNAAIQNFETADCPELVEYYTYKMKACEIRYQYLLKQIKNYREEVS